MWYLSEKKTKFKKNESSNHWSILETTLVLRDWTQPSISSRRQNCRLTNSIQTQTSPFYFSDLLHDQWPNRVFPLWNARASRTAVSWTGEINRSCWCQALRWSLFIQSFDHPEKTVRWIGQMVSKNYGTVVVLWLIKTINEALSHPPYDFFFIISKFLFYLLAQQIR